MPPRMRPKFPSSRVTCALWAAHDAVQIDDEHAVLHVLDDEAVHLLEVRDVDAALRSQVFGQLGVTA
jgi:hypothetical protein